MFITRLVSQLTVHGHFSCIIITMDLKSAVSLIEKLTDGIQTFRVPVDTWDHNPIFLGADSKTCCWA